MRVRGLRGRAHGEHAIRLLDQLSAEQRPPRSPSGPVGGEGGLRLHVAVDEARRVGTVEGGCPRPARAGPRAGLVASLAQQLAQVGAVDLLHREESTPRARKVRLSAPQDFGQPDCRGAPGLGVCGHELTRYLPCPCRPVPRCAVSRPPVPSSGSPVPAVEQARFTVPRRPIRVGADATGPRDESVGRERVAEKHAGSRECRKLLS
jgi:hypothetical protein